MNMYTVHLHTDMAIGMGTEIHEMAWVWFTLNQRRELSQQAGVLRNVAQHILRCC